MFSGKVIKIPSEGLFGRVGSGLLAVWVLKGWFCGPKTVNIF